MAKKKMSIVTHDLEHCYVCGYPRVEIHHIMFGTGYRPISDAYGLIVPLCYEHHQGDYGVHGKHGSLLNEKLKKDAQAKFEVQYGHEEWMHLFNRNYL